MLWRLHLGGVDVGDRWARLPPTGAEGERRQLRLQRHARDDGLRRRRARRAGRDCCSRRSARRCGGSDDNAAFTRDVGQPGDAGDQGLRRRATTPRPCALLRPIRAIAHRFGGSHAQRDVIDLTLIEAALRAGDGALARGACRPSAPWRGRTARCRRSSSGAAGAGRADRKSDLAARIFACIEKIAESPFAGCAADFVMKRICGRNAARPMRLASQQHRAGKSRRIGRMVHVSRDRSRHVRRQGAADRRAIRRSSARPARPLDVSRPHPGWSEQDPADWIARHGRRRSTS